MVTPLWTPSDERVAEANITRFIGFVNDRFGAGIGRDYDALQGWALAESADFWAAVWQFCGVVAAKRGDTVLADGDKFPGAKWFPDARLNFAENLLRFRDDRIALVSLIENGERVLVLLANGAQ